MAVKATMKEEKWRGQPEKDLRRKWWRRLEEAVEIEVRIKA